MQRYISSVRKIKLVLCSIHQMWVYMESGWSFALSNKCVCVCVCVIVCASYTHLNVLIFVLLSPKTITQAQVGEGRTYLVYTSSLLFIIWRQTEQELKWARYLEAGANTETMDGYCCHAHQSSQLDRPRRLEVLMRQRVSWKLTFWSFGLLINPYTHPLFPR